MPSATGRNYLLDSQSGFDVVQNDERALSSQEATGHLCEARETGRLWRHALWIKSRQDVVQQVGRVLRVLAESYDDPIGELSAFSHQSDCLCRQCRLPDATHAP